MICARCGRTLTADEVGLSRKLVNRGTRIFFCLTCMGSDFRLSEQELRSLIEAFRDAGCTLFARRAADEPTAPERSVGRGL